MTGWDREYLANKEQYLKLFDDIMQKEQDTNVEFLETSLKELTGRKYAIACSNGTDALHFSLISLNIKPGDEVLTSNFSWISTSSCISMVGATPVFCEIDLSSYHITLLLLKLNVLISPIDPAFTSFKLAPNDWAASSINAIFFSLQKKLIQLEQNTMLSEIDNHPNKLGQEKLAEFIYDRLG